MAKKIVKLMGGLGNQMFQYAFGKQLEKKHKCEVLYDLSWFELIKRKRLENPEEFADIILVRNYALDIFPNLEIKFASEKEIKKVCFPRFNKIRRLFGMKPKSGIVREKNAFIYEPELLEKRGACCFEGYFQNEKYILDIKDELIKTFELPELKPEDTYNKNLLEKIQSCKNSVFVHVRREDYVKLDRVISQNYYKNAVKYIKERVENPKFFVFCAEDTDYIKTKFDIGEEFEVIGDKNKTNENFYENLRLMMACKHAIIANSSYSWWAAWLSSQNKGIIIAPSPWLDGQSEVICEDWVKIKNN